MCYPGNYLSSLIFDISIVKCDEVKIVVDPSLQDPVYVQIYDAIVNSIASGELSPGDLLPSTRKLSKDLHISYITISKAYNLLESEGFAQMNNKRFEVLDPSEETKNEFIGRWKNTEKLMITEAKAKRIPKDVMQEILRDFLESL